MAYGWASMTQVPASRPTSTSSLLLPSTGRSSFAWPRTAHATVRHGARRPREGCSRARSDPAGDRGGQPLRHPRTVHEECLTGLSTWQATGFPAPLSWGELDPDTVEAVGAARSDGRCVASGSTRDSRPCGRDPRPPLGTYRGDDRRGPAAGAARSGRRTSGGWSPPGSSAALKHFIGAPPRGLDATSPRCRSVAARSRTCCCRPSRWHCASRRLVGVR